MNLALFYDTETSGLPLFKEPSEDPRQPHIVQLGAILVDVDTRKTINALDVIVKPEGWTIPDDVAAIHGITTDYAADVGIPEALAVEMLLKMHEQAGFRAAHNEPFDRRIVRIACKRYFSEDMANEWQNYGISNCTQKMATPIMKLPPTEKMRAAGRNHYKTPSLAEAYGFFVNRELQNAHSAADNRRDVAASQICHGQPFEWQGSVLVCFRQAPQYASRSQP
jgi:DNA polymerase-3 subunit epsilon